MSPSVPLCLFVLSANEVGLDVLSRLVTPMGSLTVFFGAISSEPAATGEASKEQIRRVAFVPVYGRK